MPAIGGSNSQSGGESLSSSAVVEYFLLETNHDTTVSAQTRNYNSRRRQALHNYGDGEILSPVSQPHDEIIPYATTPSEQNLIYFEEEEEDQDYDDNDNCQIPETTDEGLTTIPSHGRSAAFFSTPRRHSSRLNQYTELSGLNYLNLVSYTAHVVGWYGMAVAGWFFHLPSQWNRTAQYETLITPASWSVQYLWVPILMAEGIFVLAQALPHYRNRPIVTTGTSYFFFYTVLCQLMYELLYSLGFYAISFAMVGMTLVALTSLLLSQQQQHAPHLTTGSRAVSTSFLQHPGLLLEYIFFRFPFILHTGWVILMTVDHFSLLFRRYNPNDIALQLGVDVFCLGILLPVAVIALNYNYQAYDFVIPIVILWSYVSQLLDWNSLLFSDLPQGIVWFH